MEAKLKINHDLCNAIKAHMVGRKQRWLAQEIGMKDTAISNKLKGIYPFKPEEVKQIAKVLNDKKILEYPIV